VLAAIREADPDRELPSPGSSDLTEWSAQLDSLLDRILDDRDYLAGSRFLDANPCRSRRLKAVLGIPHDYFAAIPPDPTPEELETVRADLRRICGRPWAWGCTHVCALEDAHHGLLIGPCDEPVAEQEAGACRLVFKLLVTMAEGLDCTYDEWVRLFRLDVHEAAASEKKVAVTDSCQPTEAQWAAVTDAPIPLEDGHRIERRDVGWVVVDPSADCLFEIERHVWSPDEPPVFATPAEAPGALLRAREQEESRKRRYREAMISLGRPLHRPSRYEEESFLGS
jgi:hypothetical protein